MCIYADIASLVQSAVDGTSQHLYKLYMILPLDFTGFLIECKLWICTCLYRHPKLPVDSEHEHMWTITSE